MVNANVKYNNVPQKGHFYPEINKQACFEAFGYNRTQAIIQFMKEISEVAYNMLGLAGHIITNTQKICPELSPENEDDRDLIFEKCSQFIEDFEMKMLYDEPLVTSPGGTERHIQIPTILITASESTINQLYPDSLNIIKSMGLHNSFNNKKMSFVVRGWENAGKILASIIKSVLVDRPH